MDSQTIEVYNQNAVRYYARYQLVRHDWNTLFSSDVHSVRKILDIGCGSGENILRFREIGWEAFGTESSSGLRDRIIQDHLDLKEYISLDSLPFGDRLLFGGEFTHIICQAVLQHIPPELLFRSLFGIREQIALGGYLSISIPKSRSDLDSAYRDGDGRLHYLHEPERIQLLLERMGFVTLHRRDSKDSLGREGIEWVEILVQRKSSEVSSLDSIESIISKDRKTATYKLALLRALCDLAETESKSIAIRDSFVHVPIVKIAEKWLFYYLPLLSDGKIPQITGAQKNTRLKFEKEIHSLLEFYSYILGKYDSLKIVRILSFLKKDLADPVFWKFWKTGKGERDKPGFVLLRNTLRQIISTLVSGPIAFTKGAGKDPVFSLDNSKEFVLVPFPLWREFVVFDHWIRDTILIQWVDVSLRFSVFDSISHSVILDRLMFDFFPDRSQFISREIFRDNPHKICIWTNKNLDEGYDIDHLIPFSLSRNNMLWNLLPIDPRANRIKSDKLPHHSLILKRKTNLIDTWNWIADSSYSSRFFYEASASTGMDLSPGSNWSDILFDAFLESVETIALHRGVQRWGG
jgi:hypothetical protein